jgi:cytosine/adenosine deaminase-related metal-dependent hydrolase
MFQTALRAYWADALQATYFTQSREGQAGILHQFAPEDVHIGEYVGALENLSAGTTTVVDTSQCSYTPAHTDAALDAIARSGIRCVFSYSPTSGEHHPAPSYAYPHDIHRLLRDPPVTGARNRIRFALGYFVDEEDFRLGHELGLPMFAHVNFAFLGHLLEQLEPEGLVGPWNTYIHCLDLDESTWQVIARTGGKVSLSCHIEQTLGMGEPALQRALDRGIPASLGADAVSLGAVDMFTQMRAALAVQRRGIANAERDDQSAPITPLTTREVLRMATLGGAEAAHIDDLVGSLAPGKRADVVLLNTRALNTAPRTNPVGAVVHTMDTSNVETVVVDGHIVKHDGHLLDVDLDQAIDELTASAARVLSRSGYGPTIS